MAGNAENDQAKVFKDAKKGIDKAKKRRDKLTEPARRVKGQAESYAKSKAKGYAKNTLNKAGRKAGQAAAKAAKKAGEAVAKVAKALIEKIGQFFASIGPYGWLIIAIIAIIVIIILCLYGAAVYNSDRISTYIIGTQSADGSRFESIYEDDAVDVLNAVKNGEIDLGNDLPMLSREDVISVLEHVIAYNGDMNFKVKVASEYTEYSVGIDLADSGDGSITTLEDELNYLVNEFPSTDTHADGTVKYDWEKPDMSGAEEQLNELAATEETVIDETMNTHYYIGLGSPTSGLLPDNFLEEMSYGQLATINVSGTEAEKYYNGKYDIDWRVLLVLCEMMAEKNSANFGSDTDGWASEHQEDFSSDLEFETSMDGYYITDEQIEQLCKIFDYDIVCYPDSESGYDYVQEGINYYSTYLCPNGILDDISITWEHGITLSYNTDVDLKYSSADMKGMTYTLYPAVNIYGGSVHTTEGIFLKSESNSGDWTWYNHFATGHLFDYTTDNAGNVCDPYILDKDDNPVVKVIKNYEQSSLKYNTVSALPTLYNWRSEYADENPFVVEDGKAGTLEEYCSKYTIPYENLHNAGVLGTTSATIADWLGYSTGTKTLITNDEEINRFIAVKDLRVPYLAPMQMSNAFMTADYNYGEPLDESNPMWGSEAGSIMLESITITIDAQKFYSEVSQFIPDFSFDHFIELYDLYKATILDTDSTAEKESKEAYNAEIEEEETRWKNLAALYEKGEDAVKLYRDELESEAASPHYRTYKEACDEYKVTTELHNDALTEGPTGGYIFVGETSQERAASLYSTHSGSSSSVWIGDNVYKTYDGELEIKSTAKARINYADRFITENWGFDVYDVAAGTDGANGIDDAVEKMEIFCDMLYYRELRLATQVGEFNTPEMADFYSSYRGAYIWEYFSRDNHADANQKIAEELCEWQLEHEDVSVTAMLIYIAVRAYADGDPWMIDESTSYGRWVYDSINSNHSDDNIVLILNTLLDETISGNSYSLKDDQTSYFDMEFGHGFNNTADNNEAYTEQEFNYTLGGIANVSVEYGGAERTSGASWYWWMDNLFPQENIGDVTASYGNNDIAWCNYAGEVRESLLNAIGETSLCAVNWPLAVQLDEGGVKITSPYGYRLWDGALKFHRGLDIGAPAGTEILSVCDGTVIEVGYNNSCGNYIAIQNDEGYIFEYFHMIRHAVNEAGQEIKVGDEIEEGALIGYVGSTGDSTGPHLHLQIQTTMWDSNTCVDPANFLGIDENTPGWDTHPSYLTEEIANNAYGLN